MCMCVCVCVCFFFFFFFFVSYFIFLPQPPGEPTHLVIPAAVQMGWVESPGFFCTVTESARDLTQHFVNNEVALPWDPVEDLMEIEEVPIQGHTDAPTKLLQVYVDDFCHAAMQSVDDAHIPMIRRAAMPPTTWVARNHSCIRNWPKGMRTSRERKR